MNIKEIILEQKENHDSFYLYDERRIIACTDALKQNFPDISFLYSMKCNSNPHVVKSIFSQGFGADAASLGEVIAAEESGLPKDHIYYSAPGKSAKDIRQALPHCTIIADSIHEIGRIQKAAEELNTCVHIGVRVNPEFSFYGESGHCSKFGIDEAQVFDFLSGNDCGRVKITGIHVHLKSQELNAEVLANYYRNIFALAEKFQDACGFELEYINLGSGIGIPYSASDSPFNLEALARQTKDLLRQFRLTNPHTKIMIETGRYVVGKNGIYVTKVMDRKESYGKTYLILKNTLNGFIRPSLAKLVKSYSPDQNPQPTEPLFTCEDAFEILTLKDEKSPKEKVTLTGNLCTAADVIAEDITLARLQEGDVVILTNAGSYAAVLSPFQFSSQERPAEIFVTEDGGILS